MTHPPSNPAASKRRKVLTFGHSPDADDAFMFFGLATGKVGVPGYEIQHVMEDIESLNRRAETGDLDVTAVSAAHYPNIASKYRVMSCGASVGRRYGPVVVSRTPLQEQDLAGRRIAIPGEYTTSCMLFRIFVTVPFTPVFLHFDSVTPAIVEGKADAGILLHEGQILYERQGLHKVVDLGERWFESTGLPIPLGLDLVHRRLGPELGQKVANALLGSINYARANEDAALDYALGFGRGISKEDGRRFVRMYVNDDTVDMREEGRRALETLYAKAAERGLVSSPPQLDSIQARADVPPKP
ncbi:MAG: ABC transporter substrate-binding protein [Chloroflexi bacterium]|nr:ABC transporter substrate-binding protein [Chloroflexota bacterium]